MGRLDLGGGAVVSGSGISSFCISADSVDDMVDDCSVVGSGNDGEDDEEEVGDGVDDAGGVDPAGGHRRPYWV